jgi:hypothetical protein
MNLQQVGHRAAEVDLHHAAANLYARKPGGFGAAKKRQEIGFRTIQ